MERGFRGYMGRMRAGFPCSRVVAACVVMVPCLGRRRVCSSRPVAPQPSASVCLCRSSSQHLHSAHVCELSSRDPGGCDQAKAVVVELPCESELAIPFYQEQTADRLCTLYRWPSAKCQTKGCLRVSRVVAHHFRDWIGQTP